jgi:nitrite reductase/ring-hydroxylating ferredoxin subunit
MFVKVLKLSDLATGGLKAVEVDDKELVLCNNNGDVVAFDRRCGHMSAPLEMGTVDNHIATCPMHFVQFDIHTGEALNEASHPDFGDEAPTPKIGQFMQYVGTLMKHIKVCDINTYPVKIDEDYIHVNVS